MLFDPTKTQIYHQSNCCLLPRLNNLLGNGLRHWEIAVEFHGESAATFGHRTELGNITKHFGERHFRSNHLQVSAILYTLNLPAPTGKIPGNIAQPLLGDHHLDLHHWLKDNWPGALDRIL